MIITIVVIILTNVIMSPSIHKHPHRYVTETRPERERLKQEKEEKKLAHLKWIAQVVISQG